MTKVRIIYSGYYDAPLAFVVNHLDLQYLFWRVFDEALDEYPDEYEIFLLPNLSEEKIEGSWISLPELAIDYVGKIPLNQIIFGPTKRESIETDVLEQITSRFRRLKR